MYSNCVCVCFIKTCTQICTWKRSHGTHSYSICVWGCTHVSLHVCRARLHMCVYSYFTVRPQSSIPLPPSLLLLCGSVCINRTIWKASAAGPGMLTGCFVTLHPQECVAVCKCEGVREWVKGWDRHGGRERERKGQCACWCNGVKERDWLDGYWRMESEGLVSPVGVCVCEECSISEHRETPSVVMF